MSYKTILVYLSNKEEAERLVPLSALVARQFDAHLVGIHSTQNVEFYASVAMQMSSSAVAELHAIQKQHANEVKDVFEQLTHAEDFISEWKHLEITNAGTGEQLAEQARSADLVITGQLDPEHTHPGPATIQRQIIEHSGRPVLVIPRYGDVKHIGNHTLVGWSGTSQCSRAVHDAIPFFQQGKQTRIFWVNSGEKYADQRLEQSGHEMAAALDRHDINATVAHHPATEISIGDQLLNEASDTGVDLIVAGAFGHSRLYDFVIGATTTHLLKFMTVPILFSR